MWLGVGVLSFTAANVIYLAWTQFQSNAPVPSASDFGYPGIYPCVVAAVVSLVRRSDGWVPKSLWLDASLGAAGGAECAGRAAEPRCSPA